MSTYEFTMSLRIRHPTMDPARITQSLGIEPQHSWRAGEPRCDPAGAPIEGAYRESYWMTRLIEDPRLSGGTFSVESLLDQTFSQLRRSQQLFEELQADGGVAELDVTVFARKDFRLDLSADVLAAFGRLGLAIALEVRLLPSMSNRAPEAN
jgi:hypothetical protein